MSNSILLSGRFVESMPLKLCAPEDFLTEAELLCSTWKIEAPISIEDGQPFIYEVEALFYNQFLNQSQQNILAPYEALTDGPNDRASAAKPNDYSDLWTEMIATLGEYSSLLNKNSNLEMLNYRDENPKI